MRYFKDINTGDVYGYDDDQQSLIDNKLASGDYEEITGSWPTQPTLAELKEQALTSIEAKHAEMLLAAAGNPTQVEHDTWTFKASLKDAVIDGDTLNDDQLAFLNSAGFDTAAKQTAWANKVKAKAGYYAMCVGVAENIRDQAKEAVTAAKSKSSLETKLAEMQTLAEAKLTEAIALKG